MTAALIIISLVALAEAGAIIALGLMLKPQIARGDKATAQATANERNQIEATRQRDAALLELGTEKAAHATARSEANASNAQLVGTQRELNAATALLVEKRKTEIATAGPGQLLDIVNAEIKAAAAKEP